MILLQFMRERSRVIAIPRWYYSNHEGEGGMRAIAGWYDSKSWGRGLSWEIYQNDITLHHEGERNLERYSRMILLQIIKGEGWGESYARMILLYIIRERGVMRAISEWYYSKSWGRGVGLELDQYDITPNPEGEDGVRAIAGWYYSKSWGRGV